MNIRYATQNDNDEIRNLWNYCFADGEDFVNYYFKNRYDFENTIVIESTENNSDILSALQLNQYNIKLRDNNYDVSYIVGVSSKPEVRGFGYMRYLMKHTLDELYSRGQIVSILMAIDYRLYKRYGFEHCYDQLQYHIETQDLSKFKPNYILKRATKKDAKELAEIYMSAMKNLNGYVVRDEKHFEGFIEEIESENGYVYMSKDGYIAYYIQEGAFFVREMIYRKIADLNSMLGFIYNHNTQCKKAIINTPVNDKSRFIIENLKTCEIKLIPFMAGRIINFEKYIKSLDIKNTNNIDNKSINIKIIDNFISENNNTFKISIVNNQINIDKTKEDASIQLSIQSMTQLAFSYLSVEEVFLLNNIDYDSLSEEEQEILQVLFNKCENYIDELI